MATGEDVYCTMVLSDTYLPGAAVLASSLRDAGCTKKLACMIDQSNLRASTVTELQSLYNYVIPIQKIGNPRPANLFLMNRADLLYTFSKISLWRQTQFRKIVYIDADVVALRAPDELFDIEEEFAAAPDVGWPDAFNTGVMVLSPHVGTYWALETQASAGDSFDGADQGLLNQYFEHKSWKRLSFAYNCTPSANYQYEPAYRYYKRDISMVHFIGSNKPWQQGRTVKGAPGAYQELLSRWWAVYDRHFKVLAPDYVSLGQRRPGSAIRQEVKDEQSRLGGDYSSRGYPIESTPPAQPPQSVPASTEIPFTEPGERAENIDQGLVEPQPTAEERRFSAPYMEWDATRDAPPQDSKPEASNFPTTIYEFNTDTTPFRPPPAYPEPPKDIYFELPKEPQKQEERPPPIFPWEERDVPKPTRKFIEDEPLPPLPPRQLPVNAEPDFDRDFGMDELAVQSDERTDRSPPGGNIHRGMDWDPHAATSKNAWDEISGIEKYVHALSDYQRNRDKIPARRQQTHILSPTNEPDPDELIKEVQKRRESLILTDFPSEADRPSLPVTPAPIRRSTFWGGEREEDNQMPPAEGVPSQTDWDPSTQLEQLRRNSLLGPGELNLPDTRKIPDRKMPGTIASVPEEALVQPHGPIRDDSNPFAAAANDDEEILEDKAVPIVDDPGALLSNSKEKKVRVMLPPQPSLQDTAL